MPTSTKAFGTLADDSAVGTITWSNPTNAASSNDSYATAGMNATEVSHYLKGTNCSFTVGGAINSVTLNVERSVTGTLADVQDVTVKLVVAGAVAGANKAVAANWPTSDASAAYTWTVPTDVAVSDAQVNLSTFGAVLSCTVLTALGSTARVDYMELVVTYTPPSGGGLLILGAGRLLQVLAPVAGWLGLPKFAAWLRGERTQTRRLVA